MVPSVLAHGSAASKHAGPTRNPLWLIANCYLLFANCSFIQIAPAFLRRSVLLQKVRDSIVGIDLVFDFGEAVAFVLIYLELGNTAALFDGGSCLLCLRARASRIIAARES